MKVKLFINLAIVLSISICYAQPGWHTQNSGVNRELTDVCFVDQNNGWISGWTGTMLHTTNGGDTWTPQNIPPSNAYYSVFFTDLLNGWATGYDGRIVNTTDGGQTWVFQTAPVSTDFYKVYFVNSNIGWIAGGDAGTFPNYIDYRAILYTSNGGASWSAQYSQTHKSRLNSIIFVDQNNGYAAGESGVIMKTTDGGSNWSEQEIPSFNFGNIFFIDNLTGWVTGLYLGLPHRTAVFKTTNGGINWVETPFGTDESLSDIYFADNMNGWAVGGNGSGGIVYYTTDGGDNWTLQNIPSVNSLYRLYFCDENCGWAVGHLGTIIATDNPNVIEPEPSSPTEFSLEQNYPNPFNPETTIRYDLAKGSEISLTIYNIAGEKVRTLVDNFQSAGSKSVVWDGRNDRGQIVSSGVYIYQLEAGEFVDIKKMIFMK